MWWLGPRHRGRHRARPLDELAVSLNWRPSRELAPTLRSGWFLIGSQRRVEWAARSPDTGPKWTRGVITRSAAPVVLSPGGHPTRLDRILPSGVPWIEDHLSRITAAELRKRAKCACRRSSFRALLRARLSPTSAFLGGGDHNGFVDVAGRVREQQDGQHRGTEHFPDNPGPLGGGVLRPAQYDQVGAVLFGHLSHPCGDRACSQLDLVRRGAVAGVELPSRDLQVAPRRSNMTGSVASVNTWSTTSSMSATNSGNSRSSTG